MPPGVANLGICPDEGGEVAIAFVAATRPVNPSRISLLDRGPPAGSPALKEAATPQRFGTKMRRPCLLAAG